MTRIVHPLFVAVMLVWSSCSHTRTVAKQDTDRGAVKDKPSSGEAKRGPSSALPKSDEGSGTGETPLATSPAGLLKPGAARRIHQALVDRGYVSGTKQSDDLGPATQEALRAFQKDNQLPPTGAPDDATVQRLGLKPSDLFKSAQQ